MLQSRVKVKPVTVNVLSFLNESFDGTLHEVLPCTNQSIYMSLKHPEVSFFICIYKFKDFFWYIHLRFDIQSCDKSST